MTDNNDQNAAREQEHLDGRAIMKRYRYAQKEIEMGLLRRGLTPEGAREAAAEVARTRVFVAADGTVRVQHRFGGGFHPVNHVDPFASVVGEVFYGAPSGMKTEPEGIEEIKARKRASGRY